MYDYNQQSLNHNDYMLELQRLLYARTTYGKNDFYQRIFLFLQRVHGCDSGMYTSGGKFVNEQGERVIEAKNSYIFGQPNTFLNEYSHVSSVCADAAVDWVIVKEEGTYLDTNNPLVDYMFYSGDFYDLCIDFQIAGEMMYTFKKYGKDNYTTIALYRESIQNFFTAYNLEHQRQLHSFILELFLYDRNISFAIYDCNSKKKYFDDWMPEYVKANVIEHINKGFLLRGSLVLKTFMVKVPPPSTTAFVVFVTASIHAHKSIILPKDNIALHSRDSQIIAAHNTTETVGKKIAATQKALKEIALESETKNHPKFFTSTDEFFYHRKKLELKKEALSYELGKLLSYRLVR